MLFPLRVFAVAAVLALSLLASGCNQSAKKPKVVKVAVRVMYRQTTPANGAFVVFHPADAELANRIGGRPFGYAKEDGAVPITTYQEGDGVPEGDYGVTVVWEAKKDQKAGLAFEGGSTAAGDKLEGRYGDPNAPKIKATVRAGQANEFTFLVE